jgi:putative zinc finger/helix-turn-helix YgiT family protein
MKCSCGGRIKSTVENYRYDAAGLSSVTLQAVKVHRCEGCGETGVTIPRIERLHRAIAEALARKPSPLVGEEIRYLRKYLGLSSQGFAECMGVSREHVSRWETGAKVMSPPADRLLRLLIAKVQPIDDYSVEQLRAVARGPAEHTAVRRAFRPTAEGWTAVA